MNAHRIAAGTQQIDDLGEVDDGLDVAFGGALKPGGCIPFVRFRHDTIASTGIINAREHFENKSSILRRRNLRR